MDGTQLIALFRHESGDDVGPNYLWDDTLVYGFLTEAEQQAAIRGNLIRTERAITLVVGETTITLEAPRLTAIERARLQWPDADGPYMKLELVDIAEQDDGDRARDGKPQAVFRTDQTLILDRAPTEAGILHLEGYREPRYEIEAGSDEPEIDARLHPALVEWALYRAFGRRDSQTYSEQRSLAALAKFERVFGQAPTANSLRRRREKRRVTTRRLPGAIL